MMRVDGPGEPYRAPCRGVGGRRARSSVDLGVAVLPITPLALFTLMALSVPVCLGIVWILRRKRRALAFAPRRPGHTARAARHGDGAGVLLHRAARWRSSRLRRRSSNRCGRTRRSSRRAGTVLDRARSGSPYGDAGDLAPMAALRYRTPAGPRVSLGFDARGAFNGEADTAAYQDFTVGRDYPCWFDPQRPARVVLRRGPTGVALLAMLPALRAAGPRLWSATRLARVIVRGRRWPRRSDGRGRAPARSPGLRDRRPGSPGRTAPCLHGG